MRIALHTPALSAGRGRPSGAAGATDALAAALSIAGHSVDVVDDTDADRILALAQQSGQLPDAWLTYGLRPDTPDAVGAAVARGLGIPYVLVDPRGAAPGPGVSSAGAVIALSDASADWAESTLPGTPMTRLLPFIDPGPYDSVRRLHTAQSAAITHRLALDTDTPRLLFVGDMHPGDGLESCSQMARAMSRLAMVPYRLIVIGDGPARGEVEAMLRRLPLGRVHVVGGLPPEEVIPYYAISDILLAPCAGGTHGRTLLEALATGLPIVACDTPGVRDVVHDGMTGRIAPAGNAESMAMTIAFLLRERRFLDSLALATTQSISKDHHIVAAAAALDEVLTGLGLG